MKPRPMQARASRDTAGFRPHRGRSRPEPLPGDKGAWGACGERPPSQGNP
jgi:hypothetical protein